MKDQHGPKYRPDIDGLRGVAVLAVVLFHAFPTRLPGGYAGVDVFFVISGFLISTIIFTGLEDGTFTFRGFYARRIKRIFPALALVLAGACLAGWFILMSAQYAQLGEHVAAAAGFVSNLVLWRESGYFDAAVETKPLLHLWSLGIEEQFYLVWPLTLWLAWKRRFDLFRATVVTAALSFALNVWLVRSDRDAAFYLPLTRFWELLLGGMLAHALLHKPSSFSREHADGRSFLGLLLVGAGIVLLNKDRAFPGWWALLPTLGTSLMISAGPQAWINRRLLSNRLLVGVGLISYPLYLWHWPLFSFARIAELGEVSAPTRLLLILLAVSLSWLTYAFVEKPVRFGPGGRAKVAILCLSLTALAGIGLATMKRDGFKGRAVDTTEKREFLARYEALRAKGLAPAYRSECDFYDWEKKTRKESINPSCTRVGEKAVFLWGDSHAQSLSIGLREVLGKRPLAQVATSGCRPSLGPDRWNGPAGACDPSNRHALSEIERLRPDIVILAQSDKHESTDWETLAARLHALGVRKVILLGPLPHWTAPLPLIVVRKCWGKDFDYIGENLYKHVFAMDESLSVRYGQSKELVYVSLIQGLCSGSRCLARDAGSNELTAVDSAHLSPAGSLIVADKVLRHAFH